MMLHVVACLGLRKRIRRLAYTRQVSFQGKELCMGCAAVPVQRCSVWCGDVTMQCCAVLLQDDEEREKERERERERAAAAAVKAQLIAQGNSK